MEGQILNLITEERKSSVLFSPKEIETKKLASLFEAARWAPSSYNEQPWRFILTTRTDNDSFEKALSLLSDDNRVWAKNAYAIIFTFTHRFFKRNGKENFYAIYDLAQSVSYMTLQAISLGLHIHQMGGFDRDLTSETFNVPEDYTCVTAVAVGYPGELNDVPKHLMLKELQSRKRKPLQDFVFNTEWNASFF